MFRETLLESAPSGRKRKRWPMAMAFTAELIVAGLLVVLPLLSTGVIPVSARVSLVAPLGRPDVAPQTPRGPAGEGIRVLRTSVVTLLNNNVHTLPFGNRQTSDDPGPEPVGNPGVPNGVPNLLLDGPAVPPVQPPPPKRPRISVPSEAQLLTKVDPVYPRIAILTGTQGEVKLHAIIAKDGSIESLSVISGHPMLAGAAVDAVKQWRYRPYFLNGEPVEVETFITVNFKKTND